MTYHVRTPDLCTLLHLQINKPQKLEDALRETGETGDTGGKGDTGLTWSTVLRHYLTEIKSKMSEISKRL